MYKRFLSILLCLLLLMGIGLPAHADETETEETTPARMVTISSAEEFLAFAESCRLDTYSRDLTVSLESDIDLTGYSFSGIPIFSGTFCGNNHTISGLDIREDGSMQGLFRYLTAAALVQDLSVTGSVQPGGSQNEIGAIAGRNEGHIRNCSFSGNVSGGDYLGSIAGTNGITGIIEDCRTEGSLHGNHFVGGIAGENTGVIRSCTNYAAVNITPQQNSVEISDITLDTMTNAEAVNTVTDIGGIAGTSSGVIRNCQNRSDVGYQHMGYNIGGIAGTQSGYVVNCKNFGRIQGRKEVGGIIGQMEPAAYIEYTEDTLQILQGQLNTMSGLVSRASGNAQSNANGISGQIGLLHDQTQTAIDAIDTLLPDSDVPEPPDADTILAAQNTLSATLNAMPNTLSGIASATQTTLYSLTRDLNAISGQINAMSQTINNASENLGGTITDISDEDTPDLLTGKAETCTNHGEVLADLNAGGIAGAIAMENDLDILEDWEKNGEESLNFQSELRAVILNCENRSRVTGKKQNVGGIVGWQSLGLVRQCTNTAIVDAENADYVGGISGISTGFLRSNYTRCEVRGKANVGGIAGSATIVTDSLSQVKLTGGKEKLGAILGFLEDPHTDVENPILGNFYLPVESDIGAIDGISYEGLAQPLALEAFMDVENLPNLFRTVTIRFILENESVKELSVVPGTRLRRTRIPSVPKKDGFTGKWDGLEDADLTNILFDMTFEAVYSTYTPAIQTENVRKDGRPVLLAEGSFSSKATVSIEPADAAPVLDEHDELLEVWAVSLSEESTTARFLLPDDTDVAQAKLLISYEENAWETVDFHVDGSYLVFPLSSQEASLALVQTEAKLPAVYIAAAAIVPAITALVLIRKRKSKAASAAKQKNG